MKTYYTAKRAGCYNRAWKNFLTKTLLATLSAFDSVSLEKRVHSRTYTLRILDTAWPYVHAHGAINCALRVYTLFLPLYSPPHPTLCRLLNDAQSGSATCCLPFLKIPLCLSHLIGNMGKTDDVVLFRLCQGIEGSSFHFHS